MLIQFNLFFFGFLFWIIGILLGCYVINFTFDNANVHLTKEISNPYFFFIFSKIFLKNFVVGLFIAFGGLISGGALTALIFIWNGYLIVLNIFDAQSYMTPKEIGFNVIIHGTFEIAAFLWFGAIGFKGFFIIKKLLSDTPILFKDTNINLINMLIPNILLIIASLIESCLICYRI
jgi:uncharacterized membrane protein SpoIIM required for sporulation